MLPNVLGRHGMLHAHVVYCAQCARVSANAAYVRSHTQLVVLLMEHAAPGHKFSLWGQMLRGHRMSCGGCRCSGAKARKVVLFHVTRGMTAVTTNWTCQLQRFRRVVARAARVKGSKLSTSTLFASRYA